MNLRHATAVLLLAFGFFAVVVGFIGGGVGVARWANAADVQSDFIIGWIACTGVLPLLLGTVLFAAGVLLYRTTDHRLLEVRDEQGRVVRRVLPILSPLWLAVFGLLTLFAVVVISSGGSDVWLSPRNAVRIGFRLAELGLLAGVLIAAFAAWAFRRMKKPSENASPPKDSDQKNETP